MINKLLGEFYWDEMEELLHKKLEGRLVLVRPVFNKRHQPNLIGFNFQLRDIPITYTTLNALPNRETGFTKETRRLWDARMLNHYWAKRLPAVKHILIMDLDSQMYRSVSSISVLEEISYTKFMEEVEKLSNLNVIYEMIQKLKPYNDLSLPDIIKLLEQE